MTLFESGVVLVLGIESLVCLVVALVSGKGWLLGVGIGLGMAILLVHAIAHISVEWVP